MKSQTAAKPRTVFLASPYGQVGGGMGSIMDYLASRQTDASGRFHFRRLESRGGGRLIFSPLFLGWAMCRIVAEAAQMRLAIVHLNLAERGSIYRKAALLLVARMVGARVLLHLHAAQLMRLHASMSRPGRFVLRTMFRASDRVVVLGELWRRWVIESFGVSPSVVSVVRNGVPPTTVPRVPRPAGGPFRLLFLGNLLERKGISDLLHALASPAARSVDWHLTAAGGGAIDTYERLAASLGIADRVHFTGWVDQAHVRTLLAAADAMVLPSYDEGLPLVILEAMATGVPVICTPVGAIPEVFEDRHTALFVRPGDRDGLAAAIVELGRDAALQASLSREGLALYQREFTMGVFAARIGALYALLDPPQRKGRLADLGHATEAGND